MGSAFDNIQKSAFEVVKNLFAHPATWTPSAGGTTYSTKVLRREPTYKDELNGLEYSPLRRLMEYYKEDLPGLFESTRNGTLEEVTIDGDSYYVKDFISKWDGKTVVAIIEPK